MRRGSSIQMPDGQPVHDRISAVCRVPSVSTAKLGTPRLHSATVRDSKCPQPRRGLLLDDDLGVGEVVGHRRDRRGQVRVVAPGDHQHRQRPRVPQVGIGNPAFRQRRGGGHPDGGPAGLGKLPLDLVAVRRIRGGQHRLGKHVLAAA